MYQILVAGGEATERISLCTCLEQHFAGRCTLLAAENGIEAIELLALHRPQVAILEIEMSGCSGLEVARWLRRNGQPCAILFLTACEDFDCAREAIHLRVMEYLLKPYQEQKLLWTVEEALRQWQAPGEQMLTARCLPAVTEDVTTLRLEQVRENIESYIRDHYNTDLSMQEVAQAMNYSDAYFCKLFKQCFQVNFSVYLNEYRIGKARQLLQTTRLNVREVSQACGYSDPNYFTRVFKRITGKTPSEYRVF